MMFLKRVFRKLKNVCKLYMYSRVERIIPLPVYSLTAKSDYDSFLQDNSKLLQENQRFEKGLYLSQKSFSITGVCAVCQKKVPFRVDFLYASIDAETNLKIPNFRERLVCPICHLNNRMRACLHYLFSNLEAQPQSRIYITEQTTPTFQKIYEYAPQTLGSEYLGDKCAFGSSIKNIRNEDLTQLTLKNNSFDYVLSFDVLEHIPNYKKALAEIFRILDDGGCFLCSVPFVLTMEKNLIRATVDSVGNIVHILPPEYHGNPVEPDEGCLAFYHFGWELIQDLRDVGFKSVFIDKYWSEEFGYLGEGLFIVAYK